MKILAIVAAVVSIIALGWVSIRMGMEIIDELLRRLK